MPSPRITGLLNNCALNSALPILLDGISKIAALEAAGTLGRLAGNAIFKNYKQLKDIFANYYGVNDNAAFNWVEFHRFLVSHSFYANEILLAPIMRNFIAEHGLASGNYPSAAIGLLRDVQRQGRYTLLPDTEAIDLFHNQFGITVHTYEYIKHKKELDPRDNYRLINTRVTKNPDYPFGVAPVLGLYLKGRHFEIQPHEFLAEANRAYVSEMNALPIGLAEIHEGLTISQQAYNSNLNLGLLTVYGHQALVRQLARIAPSVSADDSLLPADIPEVDSVPPVGAELPAEKKDSLPLVNEPTDQPIKTKITSSGLSEIHQGYLISASTYAITGGAYHSDTPAGRQTFAALLLAILLENADKKAPAISAYLNNLAIAANGNEPLASYYADRLAMAIIQSKADLNAKLVKDVVQEIENDHQAKMNMHEVVTSNDDEKQVRLVRLAEETIQKAWQQYQETKDADLITVINKTRIIATEPTERNIRSYNQLRENVEGKGSWGKIIAGAMLVLIGVALVFAAAATTVASLGAGAPLTAAIAATGIGITTAGVVGITAGACFFNAGRNKGLYHKMQQVGDEASVQLTDDRFAETLVL